MSGGVDSSVAAALLKKQGFFVAGAYMKNFSEESWAGVVAAECPWRQDMADAQAVCEKLSIEFR
ncbi:MAG: tRNA-specific 2-thiouridylase MnmA, partial [Parcubacteria group bacterium GW2011_GWA2_52_8]